VNLLLAWANQGASPVGIPRKLPPAAAMVEDLQALVRAYAAIEPLLSPADRAAFARELEAVDASIEAARSAFIARLQRSPANDDQRDAAVCHRAYRGHYSDYGP
jgi:hypothetical protein